MGKKKIWLIIAIIVIIGILVVFFLKREKKELTFNTTTVHEETVQTIVTATGYVQPVDKVDVGTQVSGVIEKLYVDFNSQVKKGELIAELDKSTLSEKVTQANASLTSAKSDLTYAQQNYNRTKQLYDAKAATQADYEQAVNSLAQSKTGLANAQANLHQAQVNLGYAEIYSPIDGVILNRAINEGQTVASSFSTPTLFTIAKDLKKMQVEADVDEADIGQIKLGQKVTFTVDAYPDDLFEGTVHQIRLQAIVTSNVVTYTVIIEAPNPDEKLYPGMTASVNIITESETGLAVLTEALHFQPTEEMIGKDTEEKIKANKFSVDDKSQIVWTKTPQGLEEHVITTGLSDGIYVIIKSGLKESDTVILSAQQEKKTQEAAAANPLMPQRRRR